jgi:hypothetical protein
VGLVQNSGRSGQNAQISQDELAVLASTTATVIVTSAGAGSASQNYNWRLDGMIENPSNASTQTINIMADTSGAAVTLLRGSFCRIY